MGQIDDEAVVLPLHSTPPMTTKASPKSDWAWPGRVGQRHEHHPGLTSILSDIVLDRGVSAIESLFVPETLEDALGRVALLPGTP